MLKCMTRRKMMQQKQNRPHRHHQAAPPHMSATRLFMPVLLNLMRIVLQTARSDDNVDSLSSLAPIANKLAITPINVLTLLRPRAAQAHLASHFQRTQCRVHMCPRRQLHLLLQAPILATFQRALSRVLTCLQLPHCPSRRSQTCSAWLSRLQFAKHINSIGR